MGFFNGGHGERVSNIFHALAALPFGLMALDVVSHVVTKIL